MKCRRSDGREEKEGSVGEAHQYPSNKVEHTFLRYGDSFIVDLVHM